MLRRLRLPLLFSTVFTVSIFAQVPEFDWARGIGAASATAIGETTVSDASGNLFITGRFTGTIDFDPGAGTFNMTPGTTAGDAFIVKLDVDGNFVWAKQFGGTDITWGRDVTIDGSGNVYSTGIFQGTIDFDPGSATFNLTSAGSYDAFVVKLDPSGDFIWARRLGGPNQEDAIEIEVDKDGNVITIGVFVGPGAADFDPGSGTFNLSPAGLQGNVYISKLDSDGDFVFALKIGNTQGTGGRALETDASGNVYIACEFKNTVDADPGTGTLNLTSAGDADVFFSKLDANGNLIWAKKIGGTSMSFVLEWRWTRRGMYMLPEPLLKPPTSIQELGHLI